MYSIEKISKKIAGQIALKLEMDQDHEAVLAYGAFAILETVWAILLVSAFGVLLDVWAEALIISFTTAMLRKYSGGAHATSPNRCALIGTLAACGLAVMINRINAYVDDGVLLVLGSIGFMLVYYVMVRYAPIDTPQKPIKREETRKRLKRKSMYTIHLFLGFTFLLIGGYLKTGNENLLNYAIAVGVGLVWQGMTLTPMGRFIIHQLDMILQKMKL